MVELSEATQNKPLLVLALDWAKSFDCISPSALVAAHLRFGLPPRLANMIQRIDSARDFFVSECGVSSAVRSRCAGISQGGPLSPYLFSILMTVLVSDARHRLAEGHGIQLSETELTELL